jgi:hypothetical protein
MKGKLAALGIAATLSAGCAHLSFKDISPAQHGFTYSYVNLNYEYVNTHPNAYTKSAVDALENVPDHVQRIVAEQGGRILFVRDVPDLPERYARGYDFALDQYREHGNNEQRKWKYFRGIAPNDYDGERLNPVAIIFVWPNETSERLSNDGGREIKYVNNRMPAVALHEFGHNLNKAIPFSRFKSTRFYHSESQEFLELCAGHLAKKEGNPRATCDFFRLSGSPEHNEVFANLFAQYYLSPLSRKRLRSESKDMHDYFSRMEIELFLSHGK